VPHTHRYRATRLGLKIAMFITRTCARLFRYGLALVFDPHAIPIPLPRHLGRLDTAIDKFVGEYDLAA